MTAIFVSKKWGAVHSLYLINCEHNDHQLFLQDLVTYYYPVREAILLNS